MGKPAVTKASAFAPAMTGQDGVASGGRDTVSDEPQWNTLAQLNLL